MKKVLLVLVISSLFSVNAWATLYNFQPDQTSFSQLNGGLLNIATYRNGALVDSFQIRSAQGSREVLLDIDFNNLTVSS